MHDDGGHEEFQLDVRIIAHHPETDSPAMASGDCTDTCATLPNCFVDAPDTV